MDNADRLVLAIRRAVTELPTSQSHKLANAVAMHDSPTALARHAIINTVPTAIFRHYAGTLCAAWTEREEMVGSSIALAISAAADAVTDARGEQQVSVVWTGPASYEVPVRATSAVLTDLIAEAKHELIIISFAAYKVTEVVEALRLAADRDVIIRLVLESVADSKGKLSYDARLAFGSLGDRVEFYVWPAELRQTPGGTHAAMHAKCAIADARTAFVTSANLTGAAMAENMELGLVVRGGDVPRRIAAHFSALIGSGDLRMVT
jgi:phosphatidylserine/phosphatidylglycerophosphate/cardiolipin synthase-like enzyme